MPRGLILVRGKEVGIVAATQFFLRMTVEVGVGSGYQAAVLSRCVKRVFGIERIGALTQRAGKLLEELGYGNVVVRTGDGTSGWKDQSPFDAIVVAAGGPSIPEPLLEQLADGGRMVIPVDRGTDGQTLTLVEKSGNAVTTTRLDDVIFVPLIGKYGRQAGPDD